MLCGPSCPAVAADGVLALLAAGAAEVEVAGAADADIAGAAEATGVAGAELFEFEELRATTTSAKSTIPTITARTTRLDDLEVSFVTFVVSAGFVTPGFFVDVFVDSAAGIDAPGVRE